MHVLHTNILLTIQHDIIDTKRISLECVVDIAQKILQDPKCAHLFCKQTYLFLLTLSQKFVSCAPFPHAGVKLTLFIGVKHRFH
jgi:hypothetical protein